MAFLATSQSSKESDLPKLEWEYPGMVRLQYHGALLQNNDAYGLFEANMDRIMVNGDLFEDEFLYLRGKEWTSESLRDLAKAHASFFLIQEVLRTKLGLDPGADDALLRLHHAFDKAPGCRFLEFGLLEYLLDQEYSPLKLDPLYLEMLGLELFSALYYGQQRSIHKINVN
jgi:hypothetical protein